MPNVSQRGDIMPASPIRKLVPLSNAAKQRGVKVYHLNIGQPDLPTPKEGLDALKNIDRTTLEYSPSEGLLSLRKKLMEYYHRFDINVDVDDIIVTSGGSEAVLFAFMACLDPDDEIGRAGRASGNSCGVARWVVGTTATVLSELDHDGALPPREEFEALRAPRSKGILICNPNESTGDFYTSHEMNQLRDMVKKHDLFLFSDEVYREFCYTGAPYISAFHLDGIGEQVVLIDSVSKRYSECGIRIGAIITKHKELKNNLMKFCQARLSPPLLGQIVAEASIDASKQYMLMTYNEYIERRNFLIDALNKIPGVYSPIPMGAFYTVASLPVDDADKFCRWWLEEFEYEGATIFMAPASGFYTTPGIGVNEVRIAYAISKKELRGAVKVLAEALKVYPGRTI